MLITYTGSHRAVEIADTGLVAVHGEPIDVPDEIAKSLCEQGQWNAAAKADTKNKDGK